MHYCDEEVFDTELEELSPHLRFYYDCLMKPNARSVLTALKKIKELDYSTIATGHGPLLRHNVEEIVGRWAILTLPLTILYKPLKVQMIDTIDFLCKSVELQASEGEYER